MRYLFVFLLSALTLRAAAQSEDEMMVAKSFLILQSTTSYDAALKTARNAASQLNLPLDLRELKYDARSGELTWTAAECDSNGWSYPCYVARGRFDDGHYISIERSDAYEGFRKGYFIVVAASGDGQSEEMKRALQATRVKFPDAYLKTTRVYMGCMH